MKKKLLLLFVSMGLFGASSTYAQCTLDVVGDTLICPGDTVTLTAVPNQNALATTLAGGNNHRGNMFDITAINDVMITSFDAHPMGNTDYEVYYKTGTYLGSENTPGAWTLVGSATGVVAQPMGTATPLPIPVNIVIPAGQTYSFYVTSSNVGVSQNYTNGTTAGAVFAADGNIQFHEGVGIEYPFSGSAFSPRVWNGNIHYVPVVTTTFAWSTGATTPSITVTPGSTTTYTVDVTASGCATMTDSITVDISGIALDLGADINGCAGDTITLDAVNAGAAYLWHDGSTNQTFSSDTSGTMFVQVTDTIGCVVNDTIDITINPSPVIDLGVDTTICSNASIAIDAGAGYTNYAWSTGDTTQTSTVSTAGLVGVDVTDNNGCVGTDTIDIALFYAPTITDSTSDALCYGNSTGYAEIMVDGSAPNYTINWSDGDTTFVNNWLSAGTYTYDVLDTNGCVYPGSVVISEPDSISLTATTVDETVAGNGSIDLTVSGGTPGYVYSWDNSETTEDISGLTGGTYVVTVTDMNGCVNTLSVLVNSTVGIEGFELLEFNVFPVPTDGVLNIELPTEATTVEITNAVGQVVYNQQLNTNGLQTLDLSDLETGVYHIKVSTATAAGVKTIIIK